MRMFCARIVVWLCGTCIKVMQAQVIEVLYRFQSMAQQCVLFEFDDTSVRHSKGLSSQQHHTNQVVVWTYHNIAPCCPPVYNAVQEDCKTASLSSNDGVKSAVRLARCQTAQGQAWRRRAQAAAMRGSVSGHTRE